MNAQKKLKKRKKEWRTDGIIRKSVQETKCKIKCIIKNIDVKEYVETIGTEKAQGKEKTITNKGGLSIIINNLNTLNPSSKGNYWIKKQYSTTSCYKKPTLKAKKEGASGWFSWLI